MKKQKVNYDAENGFAPFVYFATDGYSHAQFGEWRITVLMIVAGNGPQNDGFQAIIIRLSKWSEFKRNSKKAEFQMNEW